MGSQVQVDAARSERSYRMFTVGGGLILVGLIAWVAVAGAGLGGASSPAAPQTPEPTPVTTATPGTTKVDPLKAISPAVCGTAAPGSGASAEGNPKAREAAQRGLGFLGREAVAWQNQHQCYGCHVQAVTLEAFAVGRDHQYTIDEPAMSTILKGMLDGPGGARQSGGMGVGAGGGLVETSNAFGGSAFARYDALVDDKARTDLIGVATRLLEFQGQNGEVRTSYNSPPVVVGTTQATYLAVSTWNQAYARTADDQWLTAVQRSERFLQARADALMGEQGATTQELNYLILGLREAGVAPSETVLVALRKRLEQAQAADGSWSDALSPGGAPSPLVTGQALYTLRMMGMTDNDGSVSRGTAWLIQQQQPGGGWSAGGFGKAEAMWGVLGLVSLDVLSVAVTGLRDGQHVDGVTSFQVKAADNQGRGVERVEVRVDDLLVASSCGDALTYGLDAARLTPGKHLIQVSATNAVGKKSERVLEVYAGNHYLTQLGSRFEQGATRFTLRNIAPNDLKNTVKVTIIARDGGAERTVQELSQEGAQGPMEVNWDGNNARGEEAGRGEYVARFSFLGADGKTVQTEDVPFVHAPIEDQRANYAQVAGQIALPEGAAAANTEVELVDNDGNVVSRTRTTKDGNWRFRNVDAGQYKVRVRKDGFVADSLDVKADKAEEVSASPMKLSAE